MLGVSFLTFSIFRIIPGDACVTTLGFGATDETIKACQEENGLDEPWYQQYGSWLADVAQGDLGTSLTESDLPVTTELNRRLPITLELMFMTMIIALFLGIPPGVLSAIRPGTPLDWIPRFSSVLFLSVPSFYLGILVITFGASWFNWTPPQFGQAYVPFVDDPWTNLQEFFFPSLVLALGISAIIMRLTRSSMLEVMRNDYIRTAYSKGLRERAVVWRHALKNAMIPVITIVGLQVGGLIGGSILVESIFALNGIGYYLLSSIVLRDLPVVKSIVLIFALAYVLINLFVDVSYAWLDPRIRYG